MQKVIDFFLTPSGVAVFFVLAAAVLGGLFYFFIIPIFDQSGDNENKAETEEDSDSPPYREPTDKELLTALADAHLGWPAT